MTDNLKVSEAELKQFADSIGAPYVLTSALHDKGIDEGFAKVIDSIEYQKNGAQGSLLTTKRQKNPKEDKGGCKC